MQIHKLTDISCQLRKLAERHFMSKLLTNIQEEITWARFISKNLFTSLVQKRDWAGLLTDK
jgi:hypothetical protein